MVVEADYAFRDAPRITCNFNLKNRFFKQIPISTTFQGTLLFMYEGAFIFQTVFLSLSSQFQFTQMIPSNVRIGMVKNC